MTIAQCSWWPVHRFIESVARQAGIGSWPEAGSPAWCSLPDDDPAKALAVLDAGQHWVLRLDAMQEARAEASKAVAGSVDWPRFARESHSRATFLAEKPWLKRVAS